MQRRVEGDIEMATFYTAIADYDVDIDYPKYWRGRRYEHLSEVVALEHLLDAHLADWTVDLGGGFGRWYPLLRERCDRVMLVDYSLSLLQEARRQWGDDLPLVRANLYWLPFARQSFRSALVSRVLHHLVAYDRAFAEMSRVVSGSLVVDIPNKRHALARWRARLNPAGPDIQSHAPINRSVTGDTHLNFHPAAVVASFSRQGWSLSDARSACSFRALGRVPLVPSGWLAGLERPLQRWGGRSMLGPSILTSLQRPLEPTAHATSQPEELLRCPACRGRFLPETSRLVCRRCGARFPILAHWFWDLRWPRP